MYHVLSYVIQSSASLSALEEFLPGFLFVHITQTDTLLF